MAVSHGLLLLKSSPHQLSGRPKNITSNIFESAAARIVPFDEMWKGPESPDCPTASLFPGTAALETTNQMVVANFVPKLNAWRLTMTFPVINQARAVCFLISAAKNPELVDRVIAGDRQYPAARVNPASGNLFWFLGEKA